MSRYFYILNNKCNIKARYELQDCNLTISLHSKQLEKCIILFVTELDYQFYFMCICKLYK